MGLSMGLSLGLSPNLSLNFLKGVMVVLVFAFACWTIVLAVFRRAVFNLAEEQKVKLNETLFSVNDVDLEDLHENKSKYDYKLPFKMHICVPGSTALGTFTV